MIAKTKNDSETFAGQCPVGKEGLHQIQPTMRNVKTTLLVCPLSTINNWADQIKTHVQPGGLTYYLYHGPRRKSDPDFLATFDIVITTFNLIASEWTKHENDKTKPGGPLQRVRFFRIVLDGVGSSILNSLIWILC